jgi:hypothetical protein
MVHGATGKQVSGRNEGPVSPSRTSARGAPDRSPARMNRAPASTAGGGQAQDAGQRVAAATGRSQVGDGGEVGRQVRGFVVLELAGIGVGELGQRGWDRVGRHGRPSGS